MKWFICSVLLFSFSFSASATFAPPNDLKMYETLDLETMAITKASFERAIFLVQRAYPTIHINNLWANGTVNAQAYVKWGVRYVDAFGGLARYGRMTTAAYVGVLCHESGHHLGGAPRYAWDWASVEGQSDYWGFRTCMRKVGFTDQDILTAAVSLASVLASLNGDRIPQLNTPDLTKVSKTLETHPNAQCRLDTMVAALKYRARPRCWYYPYSFSGEGNENESTEQETNDWWIGWIGGSRWSGRVGIDIARIGTEHRRRRFEDGDNALHDCFYTGLEDRKA